MIQNRACSLDATASLDNASKLKVTPSSSSSRTEGTTMLGIFHGVADGSGKFNIRKGCA